MSMLHHHRHYYPVPPGLKVIWTNQEPVIPLALLRQQCEVMAIDFDSDLGAETSPHDALLMAYLDAAVDYAEDVTGLSINQRIYEIAMDCFPPTGGIELLRPPVIEIISFTFGEGSDAEIEPEAYIYDDYRSPPRLLPVVAWPAVIHSTNAIKLRYRAGFRPGNEQDSDDSNLDLDAPVLPAAIKQALLLLTAHFFNNREDSVEKVLSTIPNGFMDLLRMKSVRIGMA